MRTKLKLLLLAAAATAPLMLSGCIVVPERGGYYGPPAAVVGPPAVVVRPYGYYGYRGGYRGGYYGGPHYRYLVALILPTPPWPAAARETGGYGGRLRPHPSGPRVTSSGCRAGLRFPIRAPANLC